MKNQWSKAFQMDKRNFRSIWVQCLFWALAIYAANTDIINWIIQDYVQKDVAAVIIMILAYSVRKWATDYSKK